MQPIDPTLPLALIVCAGLFAREIWDMRAVNREQAREIASLRSARRRTAAVLLRVKRERDDKKAAVRELVADIYEREREEERKRGAKGLWVN